MEGGIHECDVLIVGAGPTGSALAMFLARCGVRVLLADAEADIYKLPRAAHVDHEAMRIFQALGVADTVAASCRQVSRYDFVNASGDVLLSFDGSDAMGPGGWPTANMIHQPSIERALRDAMAELPRIRLCPRWKLSALMQGGHVAATFDTPDGVRQVAARFAVGADGARSSVRTLSGIDYEDLRFDEPWLVVDAIVHDRSRLPEVNLQVCDPARPTTCVVMGAGRHRWEFMLKPGETAEQVSQDDFIAGLLAPWNVEGAVTIERKAVYRFGAKVAAEWRKGAIMLAGDAAHLMPPFAGQGLCSGLRDAANLAWKLAAVVNDGAPADRLLGSYQSEREPHVRAIIGLAMMMGRTVCLLDQDAAAARDAEMIAARAANPGGQAGIGWPPFAAGCLLPGTPGAGAYFPQVAADGPYPVRLDDALGPGAWLISRTVTPPPAGAYRAFSTDDAALAPFRPGLLRWLDEAGSEAVLVRPDRSVFGAGDPSLLAEAYCGFVTSSAPVRAGQSPARVL